MLLTKLDGTKAPLRRHVLSGEPGPGSATALYLRSGGTASPALILVQKVTPLRRHKEEPMVQKIGVDWDAKDIHVSEDGILDHVYTLPDMETLRRELDLRTGLSYQVTVESTYSSFDLDLRDQTILDYADSGIDLRSISPRMTSWWRVARGLEKTTDAQDAVAIWHITNDPRVHLKRPVVSTEIDPEWNQTRETAEHEIMVLRRTGRKDDFADKIIAQLPRLKDQPKIRQWALGGKEYSQVTVAAVGVIAAYAQNTFEFERMAGLYGAGMPSQFRSDLMHWGWRPKLEKEPVPGETTKTGRPKMRVKIFEDGRPKAKEITLEDGSVGRPKLSDYRRELRWLYRQVAQVDLSV